MSFQLNDSKASDRSIEYIKDNEKLGEITWLEGNSVMQMTHTFVSDKLRGQGIAKKLLDEAAAYARKNDFKMKPVCSYVVMAFDKYTDYDDVKA